MKTKYSSLVGVKKNIMQKSERALLSANSNLNNALLALESSIKSLDEINIPSNGEISKFLSYRALLDTQRAIIKHNEEWCQFAKNEVENMKQTLKMDMIEYEKFNYLELEDIKKTTEIRMKKESKELDEIALITYGKQKDIKEAS